MVKKYCDNCGETKISEYENLVGFAVDYCDTCGTSSAFGFPEKDLTSKE